MAALRSVGSSGQKEEEGDDDGRIVGTGIYISSSLRDFCYFDIDTHEVSATSPINSSSLAAAITTATTTTTTTTITITTAAVVLGKEKAAEEEMQSNTRSWKRMGIERKFIHIERMAGKRNHPQICT